MWKIEFIKMSSMRDRETRNSLINLKNICVFWSFPPFSLCTMTMLNDSSRDDTFWNCQRDGVNTFLSNGKCITKWNYQNIAHIIFDLWIDRTYCGWCSHCCNTPNRRRRQWNVTSGLFITNHWQLSHGANPTYCQLSNAARTNCVNYAWKHLAALEIQFQEFANESKTSRFSRVTKLGISMSFIDWSVQPVCRDGIQRKSWALSTCHILILRREYEWICRNFVDESGRRMTTDE